MQFSFSNYSAEVARILALGGSQSRAMPLTASACLCDEARAELNRHTARGLFPGAHSPEGAMAGLYLYFSCADEAHAIAQDLGSAEGSFWHGILHRQEPDPFNAGYWFRRVGEHPVFPALRDAAMEPGYDAGAKWDPFRFIDFCENARRRSGSAEEGLAKQVQLVEWQLLFDWCAREKNG